MRRPGAPDVHAAGENLASSGHRPPEAAGQTLIQRTIRCTPDSSPLKVRLDSP